MDIFMVNDAYHKYDKIHISYLKTTSTRKVIVGCEHIYLLYIPRVLNKKGTWKMRPLMLTFSKMVHRRR